MKTARSNDLAIVESEPSGADSVWLGVGPRNPY